MLIVELFNSLMANPLKAIVMGLCASLAIMYGQLVETRVAFASLAVEVETHDGDISHLIKSEEKLQDILFDLTGTISRIDQSLINMEKGIDELKSNKK